MASSKSDRTEAINVRIGRPEASIDNIINAAKKACIHQTIILLPDGYDTILGVSGTLLSGGEKHRLDIARAILKDAPIIILDEASSAVDPENENLVQRAIAALAHNKTVIMIAHRLGTIIDADQIIVMDCGRIADIGRHSALLSKSGIYSQLWKAYSITHKWSMRAT